MMDFTGLYILFGGLLLIAAGLVVLYFVRAAALFRMAQNAGMPSPALAWIPIAGDYILGCLCDRAAAHHNARPWRFRILLPILRAVGSPWLYVLLMEALSYGSYGFPMQAVSWVFTSGLQALLGFAAWALTALGLYHLYWDYAPGRQDVFTVLSIVFPPVAPAICIFLIRWNIPLSVREVQPPRKAAPPPPAPQSPGYNKQNKK